MKNEEVWACGPEGNPLPDQYAWGPPCATEEITIYVWAKNATKLELPEDVSFKLRASSHIVLALHYKNPGKLPKEIVPGIDVRVTTKPTSKTAGVFQIINDFNMISPNRTGFLIVFTCYAAELKMILSKSTFTTLEKTTPAENQKLTIVASLLEIELRRPICSPICRRFISFHLIFNTILNTL